MEKVAESAPCGSAVEIGAIDERDRVLDGGEGRMERPEQAGLEVGSDAVGEDGDAESGESEGLDEFVRAASDLAGRKEGK